MATKETAIRDLLKASGAWTGLVTGGTYILDELGRTGLSMNSLPAAAKDANGALKLTCVITFGASAEAEVSGNTQRGFFTLWLYHYSDYSVIRQARRKAKDLLDRKQVSTTDEGSPFLFWVNDAPEYREDELGGALACYSRYAVQFGRY